MWSNLKVKVPAPAVAERISTIRSPISASGILARTTSQPSQPSRVSKPRIWPRRPDISALIFAVASFGADDLDQMDRLEQHRLALRQAFDDADAAGGAERHVGGIDGVIRAVDQRHVQVDHRKAERAVLERVDDAFLDGGNVVARHHAAGDLVLEGKARAARHRLDVEHDVAVLAVAARLLLVPAALHDAFADGLAVADARLAPLDGDAVAVARAAR